MKYPFVTNKCESIVMNLGSSTIIFIFLIIDFIVAYVGKNIFFIFFQSDNFSFSFNKNGNILYESTPYESFVFFSILVNTFLILIQGLVFFYVVRIELTNRLSIGNGLVSPIFYFIIFVIIIIILEPTFRNSPTKDFLTFKLIPLTILGPILLGLRILYFKHLYLLLLKEDE